MSFDFEIGTACNNKCIFCSAASRNSDFSTEQALKLLKENGVRGGVLCITGGEPTVRPDFIQIISTAVTAGYNYIMLQTNGRAFADPELAKKVVNLGFTGFLVSIHGLDAAMHDALTQSPGSFEQTISGIKNLLRFGGSVTTLTVITKGNFNSLAKITEMLISLGVNIPVYAFPMIAGRASSNFESVVPHYEEMAPYLIESFKLIEKNSPRQAWAASVQDVPFCFLKGRERYAHEVNYAETTTICFNQANDGQAQKDTPPKDVFYLENEIESRILKKIKPPSCEKCIYFQMCEGIQQTYIDNYGADEFVPVTSSDPSVTVKESSLTLEGSLIPVLDSLCRFNGRDFGGFLIKNESLIAVTRRGRQTLKLLSGENTLSEISGLYGSHILPFIISLKERGMLRFRNKKIPPQGSMLNLLNQVNLKNFTGGLDEAFELPLYIPWHESYQISLTL